MSTEDQNRCVVTVEKGIDVDSLMEEICSQGGTTPYVPTRAVEMFNEKPDSERNFDVILTQEEAKQLREDPRIVEVRYGSKEENNMFLGRCSIDSSRTYQRSTTQTNAHYNWAIPHCSSTTNPFTGGILNPISYAWPYTMIGEGVDAVVFDSGIQANHPEWLAQDGVTSRLQQINWPAASGLSGIYTQGAQFYTDQYGHGTHCASSMAGRLYGWARGANIYAIKIFDTNAFGVSAGFNMLRLWHLSKNGSRPTVVNHSWGYYSVYTDVQGGSYRGTPWTGTAEDQAKGMRQYSYNSTYGAYQHPVRVASVDADIQSCIDAGIIMVAAAGNDDHKADVPGGLDYDNWWKNSGWTSSADNIYYNRGSTPGGSSGIISVGATAYSNNDYKSVFSTTGPRVDIYCPGEAIQSAMSAGSTLSGSSTTYPLNGSFIVKKIQGTSMACPQVAGVLACLVGSRKNYTPSDCLNWLVSQSTKNRMSETSPGNGTSYTDSTSLRGGNNRFLYWPFAQSQNPIIISRT